MFGISPENAAFYGAAAAIGVPLIANFLKNFGLTGENVEQNALLSAYSLCSFLINLLLIALTFHGIADMIQ